MSVISCSCRFSGLICFCRYFQSSLHGSGSFAKAQPMRSHEDTTFGEAAIPAASASSALQQNQRVPLRVSQLRLNSKPLSTYDLNQGTSDKGANGITVPGVVAEVNVSKSIHARKPTAVRKSTSASDVPLQPTQSTQASPTNSVVHAPLPIQGLRGALTSNASAPPSKQSLSVPILKARLPIEEPPHPPTPKAVTPAEEPHPASNPKVVACPSELDVPAPKAPARVEEPSLAPAPKAAVRVEEALSDPKVATCPPGPARVEEPSRPPTPKCATPVEEPPRPPTPKPAAPTEEPQPASDPKVAACPPGPARVEELPRPLTPKCATPVEEPSRPPTPKPAAPAEGPQPASDPKVATCPPGPARVEEPPRRPTPKCATPVEEPSRPPTPKPAAPTEEPQPASDPKVAACPPGPARVEEKSLDAPAPKAPVPMKAALPTDEPLSASDPKVASSPQTTTLTPTPRLSVPTPTAAVSSTKARASDEELPRTPPPKRALPAEKPLPAPNPKVTASLPGSAFVAASKAGAPIEELLRACTPKSAAATVEESLHTAGTTAANLASTASPVPGMRPSPSSLKGPELVEESLRTPIPKASAPPEVPTSEPAAASSASPKFSVPDEELSVPPSKAHKQTPISIAHPTAPRNNSAPASQPFETPIAPKEAEFSNSKCADSRKKKLGSSIPASSKSSKSTSTSNQAHRTSRLPRPGSREPSEPAGPPSSPPTHRGFNSRIPRPCRTNSSGVSSDSSGASVASGRTVPVRTPASAVHPFKASVSSPEKVTPKSSLRGRSDAGETVSPFSSLGLNIHT